MSKAEVSSWQTRATFTASFPTCDGVEVCTVEVQIGQAVGGLWYVRTRDDAGGEDEGEDEGHPTERTALTAARRLARSMDESDGLSAAGD